jgi:short-subunit dehydrogenase
LEEVQRRATLSAREIQIMRDHDASPTWRGRAQPVVVVTGATAGVGRASACAFAARGAAVALLARDHGRLAATAREVEAAGGVALPLVVDVADAGAVERAAAAVEERFGRMDVWVNNASVTVFAPVARMEAAEYRRVMEVAYLGYVHGTLAALRAMRRRGEGVIVQVGSALGYRGIPLQSAYCAAKAAIRGFTESLRAELVHDGSRIRVAMVELPAINTPQFHWSRTKLGREPRPVAPVYAPSVAAAAIVAAALAGHREIFVGRSTLMTVLGNAIAPGLADRVAARSWEGQLTDVPVARDRPDNLFSAPSGAAGAAGPFGEEAAPWAARVRREAVLPGALAVLTLVALSAYAWRKRHALARPHI